MTSASNHHPATTTQAVPDGRLDIVANRIAADWGHHTHAALTMMIAELYTALAVLPPHCTPHQRAEVIAEAADTTASELTTLLDDYLHREADRPPVTEYGATLHTDDRHHTLTTMLAALAADHLTWWLTDRLADVITNRRRR